MSITLTIPDDKRHITAAAKFFADLADIGLIIPTFDGQFVITPADVEKCSTIAGKTADVMIFDDVEHTASPVDVSSAFMATTVVAQHPTTESLLTGNGIPEYDGVPFDVTPPTPVPPAPPTPVPPAPPTPVPPAPPVTPQPFVPPEPTRNVPGPIASGVKLDAEGLPWDRRIHASTKTLRQSDNTWKLIRGVQEGLVAKVKDELRTAMGQAAPVGSNGGVMVPTEQFNAGTIPQHVVNQIITPPAPPTGLPNLDNDSSWPAPPSVVEDAALVTPPPPVLALVQPPAPPAPPAADPFPEFVQFCTSNQQSGRLEYTAIVSTCQKYGITQLPMLNARHDLIPTIRTELEALCKS